MMQEIVNAHIAPLVGRPTGAITVLNSRCKNEGWNGSLQSLTFGPYKLSRKVWRAAHSIVGASPSTLTSDLTLTV